MISEPFKARYLPVDQWPLACQRLWCDAFTEADLFEAAKPATLWRKTTVRKNCCAFGTFTSWTIYKGDWNPDAAPAEFVTPARVKGFLADLEASDYASNTVFCHLQGLYDSVRVMDPETDWDWLLNAVKKIRSRAKPVRDKLQRLQSAQKLDMLGQKLMQDAEAMELIRSMIERVDLHPREGGTGLDAILHGDLAAILAACAGAQKANAPDLAATGRQLSVVAGTRSPLYRTRHSLSASKTPQD